MGLEDPDAIREVQAFVSADTFSPWLNSEVYIRKNFSKTLGEVSVGVTRRYIDSLPFDKHVMFRKGKHLSLNIQHDLETLELSCSDKRVDGKLCHWTDDNFNISDEAHVVEGQIAAVMVVACASQFGACSSACGHKIHV